MYSFAMKSFSTTDARSKFAEMLASSQTEPVAIDRHGETQAVVVSMAEYVRMRDALDEQEDLAAFDAALAEEGDNIAWELARADLGWV